MKTPWFEYPAFHWTKKHAIVIGAGIAGCQSAGHLLATGWQVTLIERHPLIAQEASGNKAGAIMPKMTALPSLGEDFYIEAFRYTLKQLKQLNTSNKALHYALCGVVQLAHTPREEKRWQALQQRGFEDTFLQCLSVEETRRCSGISASYKSTYFPQGGWIDPVSYCQVLIDHPKCQTVLRTEAIQLQQDQSQWHVLDSEGHSLAQAEVVIIANGKDLKQFEQTAGLPAQSVLGQTSEAAATPLSARLNTVIGHDGYLTPAINGQHVFGATFERNKKDTGLNSTADQINQQSLQHYLAEFSDTLGHIKSSHAALRMTTPDRFPYVGAVIDSNFYQQHYADLHQGKHWKPYPVGQYQNGLFVLAGLGSRGLTTGGYCASLLVESINGKAPKGKLIDALHTGRFVIRGLKKNKKRL